VYAQAVEQSLDWSAGERINLTELRQIHRLVVEPAWLHSPPEGLGQREGPRLVPSARYPSVHGRDDTAALPGGASARHRLARPRRSRAADGQHPMLFVAGIHARFERIHLFRDGNGRVGRLATNLLLVRHGYPPAVIYKRDRCSRATHSPSRPSGAGCVPFGGRISGTRRGNGSRTTRRAATSAREFDPLERHKNQTGQLRYSPSCAIREEVSARAR
jgi:hypothetical protein